ncbi:unnamed protein product, partial [Choristocarpus tenellus]
MGWALLGAMGLTSQICLSCYFFMLPWGKGNLYPPFFPVCVQAFTICSVDSFFIADVKRQARYLHHMFFPVNGNMIKTSLTACWKYSPTNQTLDLKVVSNCSVK